MARKSGTERAIEQIDAEIAVLVAARKRLEKQLADEAARKAAAKAPE